MKKKILSIPFIQFICCAMIVILHSNNINSFSFNISEGIGNHIVGNIENIFTIAGHSALPIFFFITGYLYFYECKWSIHTYKTKIISRIHSLVVPYLFWNTFTVGFYWCISRIPQIANKLNHMYVPNEIGVIFKAILVSSYTPLWYVRNIFILALLSIAIERILREKYLCWIMIIFLIGINFFHPFNYYGIVYWLPIYLMGCACAYYRIGFPRLGKYKWVIRVGYGCIFGLNVAFCGLKFLYIYRIISPLVLINWLDEIYQKKKTNRIYYKFTFFVYCTHFLVISIFQKCMVMLLGNKWDITLLVYIITPLFCISLLCFIAAIIYNKCPKIWKFVNGGR